MNNQKYVLEKILNQTQAQPSGEGQWNGRCPTHEDKHPSLSIKNDEKEHKILLYCHAGCETQQIMKHLGVESLTFNSTAALNGESQIEAVYDYTDENDQLLFQSVRYHPKRFLQRRPDGHGNWIWNLKGVNQVLFRLPALMQADPTETVYIVEGEKDVLAMEANGFLATCNPGGAGKWKDVYSEILRNRTVVIISDNDEAGRSHAEQIAQSLNGKAAEIRLLELSGLPPKGDVSDWFAAGNNAETLKNVTNSAHLWKQAKIIQPINLEELLKHPFPPRESLIAPWLPKQGLAMIYARRGIGKTYLSLSVAYAAASGNNLFGWSVPKTSRVLFIDGEMPGCILRDRLAQIVVGFEHELKDPEAFRVFTPDLYEGGIPDLATAEGQQQIEAYLDDVDLLVLDNLSTLFRNGSENDSDSWLAIQEWLLKLRRLGKTILIIHHAGKTGNQRGTSKREDVLDVVMQLRHPSDYQAEDGCRFEVHFEKARHLFGVDVTPFEATLNIEDDKVLWTYRTIRHDELEKVKQLLDQGLSQRKIADELEMSVGKINRLCREIREPEGNAFQSNAGGGS